MTDLERIYDWLANLDQLNHYELLRVAPKATHDEVRHAFHAFAAIFHPDAQAERNDIERAALTRIFRRGADAFHVLSDSKARAAYDLNLRQKAKKR